VTIFHAPLYALGLDVERQNHDHPEPGKETALPAWREAEWLVLLPVRLLVSDGAVPDGPALMDGVGC
jgi:hypothetical protein